MPEFIEVDGLPVTIGGPHHRHRRGGGAMLEEDLTGALEELSALLTLRVVKGNGHVSRGNRCQALLNHLAWLRAACPADDIRDAAAAVRDATRANELTGYDRPGYLDTLAAAYAEAGRFEEAVRWQEKAAGLVPPDERPGYEARLALYRAGKAYREEEPEGE